MTDELTLVEKLDLMLRDEALRSVVLEIGVRELDDYGPPSGPYSSFRIEGRASGAGVGDDIVVVQPGGSDWQARVARTWEIWQAVRAELTSAPPVERRQLPGDLEDLINVSVQLADGITNSGLTINRRKGHGTTTVWVSCDARVRISTEDCWDGEEAEWWPPIVEAATRLQKAKEAGLLELGD